MRKLEIKDAEIIRLAVQDEILADPRSRDMTDRLHGILWSAAASVVPRWQSSSGAVRRTIPDWVRRSSRAVCRTRRRFPVADVHQR